MSFAASTRSEDNILNCDEELGTVLLQLQEILVAHVVEDYVYRGCRKLGASSSGRNLFLKELLTPRRRCESMNPIWHKVCKPQYPGGKRSADGDDEKYHRNRRRNPRHPSQLPDLLTCSLPAYSKSDPLRYPQRNPIEMSVAVQVAVSKTYRA